LSDCQRRVAGRHVSRGGHPLPATVPAAILAELPAG